MSDPVIDVVRGNLDGPHTEAVLQFWLDQDALSGQEARNRLRELVCVLRIDGAVAAVSSVYAAEAPLIGSRRFWIYRNLLGPGAEDHGPALISATFAALDAEFDHQPESPIGLCVLISDPAERRRRPEAVWTDPFMLYAGYTQDGRQVRIGYFTEADITRPPSLA